MPPYEPSELSELDHWLTARWRLYTREADGLGHQLAATIPGRCIEPGWCTSTRT